MKINEKLESHCANALTFYCLLLSYAVVLKSETQERTKSGMFVYVSSFLVKY